MVGFSIIDKPKNIGYYEHVGCQKLQHFLSNYRNHIWRAGLRTLEKVKKFIGRSYALRKFRNPKDSKGELFNGLHRMLRQKA